MKTRRLSKEEEHQRDLEQLAAYRPLDDDFKRAEKTKYYKENPKGVSNMCKMMEDRLYNDRIQIAFDLLAMERLTYDEISQATRLSLSTVEEIAKELESSKA